MSRYTNRQELELNAWPELRDKLQELKNLVNSERSIPKEFKRMLFTMASIAGGCVHCQSHGAYSMDKMNAAFAAMRLTRQDLSVRLSVARPWADSSYCLGRCKSESQSVEARCFV